MNAKKTFIYETILFALTCLILAIGMLVFYLDDPQIRKIFFWGGGVLLTAYLIVILCWVKTPKI